MRGGYGLYSAFLLFTHISEPTSDAKQYVDLAKNAYENGVWYPSKLNIHDTYLFGNGLVNILILFLKLTGSIAPVYALNFISVYVILFSCCYILKKLLPSSQAVYYFNNYFFAHRFFLGRSYFCSHRSFIHRGGSGGTTRKVLKFYNRSFLDKNMYMTLGLGIVFYSLWCVDSGTVAMYSDKIIFTIPLVVIICMKYSLTLEGDSDGDPISVIFHDKWLMALALFYAALILFIIYIF